MRLLQAAAECWDRLEQARELLQRDGLVIEGREGRNASTPRRSH